jgi:hypothetical protein
VPTWRLHAFPLEPLTADFPFARTLVGVRRERTIKPTGQTTTESRYDLASAQPEEYPPPQWLE